MGDDNQETHNKIAELDKRQALYEQKVDMVVSEVSEMKKAMNRFVIVVLVAIAGAFMRFVIAGGLTIVDK